jgi:hypothetical protein
MDGESEILAVLAHRDAGKKKKVNTTAIGNRTATKGKKELEREGFFVCAAKKGRAKNYAGFWFSYGEDFFGLFDAIAIGKAFDVRLVQFKTDAGPTGRGKTNVAKKDIEEWAAPLDYHDAQDVTLEVWTWVKRKGWVKEILNSDYTWSTREHFHSSPRKEGEAAGDNADRPAAPDGKSGELASPARNPG